MPTAPVRFSKISNVMDNETTGRPAVTCDGLLGGRVRLMQPRDGHRAGLEPVLMAAALEPKPDGRVLELGMGAGAAALCLLARRSDLVVTGLEIAPALADLAVRGAVLSNLGARLAAVCGDVKALPFRPAGFDAVMFNPPFYAGGNRSPDPMRRQARSTTDGLLAAFFEAAFDSLRDKGRLCAILPPGLLPEALSCLDAQAARPRAGAIRLTPVYSRAGSTTARVLVRAVKGRRTPLSIDSGIVLHEADGRYTAAAEAILRDAGPLS